MIHKIRHVTDCLYMDATKYSSNMDMHTQWKTYSFVPFWKLKAVRNGYDKPAGDFLVFAKKVIVQMFDIISGRGMCRI